MQQPHPSLLPRPIAFAHRGARAYSPENTLEAFGLALQQGATGLESDVWITADGVPVLDHDGLVRRGFGRGTPISGLRRDQLPAHIPALTDLFATCGHQYHLSLDLKDPGAGERVIAVTREAAPELLPRLWLCAPVWQSLLPLRDCGARLVDSTRLAKIKEGPERRAATLSSNGIDAINLHHTDWNGGLAALFHRFERVAFGWDMQHEQVLAAGIAMGLDAVYCDSPDRMMAVFKEMLGE